MTYIAFINFNNIYIMFYFNNIIFIYSIHSNNLYYLNNLYYIYLYYNIYIISMTYVVFICINFNNVVLYLFIL